MEEWESEERRQLAGDDGLGQQQPKVFYYWFDLFSNGQHLTPSRPFSWWQTTFRSNIERIKHTLLVLDYATVLPVTRAWCLWEIVATIDTGARLTIVMPPGPDDAGAFQRALLEDFRSVAAKTSKVDLSLAQAFKDEDRKAILRAAEESVGLERANAIVIKGLQRWMVQAGKRALEQLLTTMVSTHDGATEERALSLKHCLGELMRDVGDDYDEAEALLRDVYEARRRQISVSSIASAASIASSSFAATANQLANLLMQRGNRLVEASKLYEEAIAALNSNSDGHDAGGRHRQALILSHNLACLLREAGLYSQATVKCREVLEARKRLFGDDHEDTLASSHLLSSLLAAGATSLASAEMAEALELARDTLQRRETLLGEAHPETLSSLNDIALLLKRTGDHKAAETMYRRCVTLGSRVQGSHHPETLTSMANLATLLLHVNGDDDDEAAALLKAVYRGRRRAFGPSGVPTLTSMAALASALGNRSRGLPLLSASGAAGADIDIDEDLPLGTDELFSLAVEGLTLALGEAHPETLTALNNYAAWLYDKQPFSRMQEAAGAFERILAIRKRRGDSFAPDEGLLAVMINYATALGDTAMATAASKALEAAREAVAACEAFYPREQRSSHPTCLSAYSTLAGILVDCGRYDEGEALYRRVVEGKKRHALESMLGPMVASAGHAGLEGIPAALVEMVATNDPATLIAEHNLSCAMTAKASASASASLAGDDAHAEVGAVKLLESAEAISARVYAFFSGRDTDKDVMGPCTVSALQQLATLRLQRCLCTLQQRHQHHASTDANADADAIRGVLDLLRRVYANRRATQGPGHPKTRKAGLALATAALALSLSSTGDNDPATEALRVINECLHLNEHGGDDMDTSPVSLALLSLKAAGALFLSSLVDGHSVDNGQSETASELLHRATDACCQLKAPGHAWAMDMDTACGSREHPNRLALLQNQALLSRLRPDTSAPANASGAPAASHHHDLDLEFGPGLNLWQRWRFIVSP